MSYELWKVVHLFGIFLLFGALGGLAALRGAGGVSERAYMMLHGIAMLIVLVGGFALLAQLGLSSPATWAAWIWIKLVVYLLLGASLAALRRLRVRADVLVLLLALLGALAAWAALVKPAL